jgi:hypothetical protein
MNTKTEGGETLVGIGGEWFVPWRAVEFLRETAQRWERIATSYPYTKDKPDIEALALCNRNNGWADEIEKAFPIREQP